MPFLLCLCVALQPSGDGHDDDTLPSVPLDCAEAVEVDVGGGGADEYGDGVFGFALFFEGEDDVDGDFGVVGDGQVAAGEGEDVFVFAGPFAQGEPGGAATGVFVEGPDIEASGFVDGDAGFRGPG